MILSVCYLDRNVPAKGTFFKKIFKELPVN
jgi:hypothetical protein